MTERQRIALPRRRPIEATSPVTLRSLRAANASTDQSASLVNGHLFNQVLLGAPVPLIQRKEPQGDGMTGNDHQ